MNRHLSALLGSNARIQERTLSNCSTSHIKYKVWDWLERAVPTDTTHHWFNTAGKSRPQTLPIMLAFNTKFGGHSSTVIRSPIESLTRPSDTAVKCMRWGLNAPLSCFLIRLSLPTLQLWFATEVGVVHIAFTRIMVPFVRSATLSLASRSVHFNGTQWDVGPEWSRLCHDGLSASGLQGTDSLNSKAA